MTYLHSYTSDFLVWWKDYWIGTPGANPSPEMKAAAWAAWQAGRDREQSIWGNEMSDNEIEEVYDRRSGKD